MATKKKYSPFEEAARKWALITKKDLLRQLLRQGIDDRIAISKQAAKIRFSTSSDGSKSAYKEDYLARSLSYKIRKSYGDIDTISLVFARHGLFIEHGTGRGRPVGSSGAAAAKKPWLSVVIPPRIEDLADILAEHAADEAAQEARILIPGVIDTKIKG